MSQASQIARYRPAVIAVTGAAAAFGIWTLYSTFADQSTKAPLHRSNAVRRTRASSLEPPVVEYSTGIDHLEEPFGSVFIKRHNVVVEHLVFARNKIPSLEDWTNLYGSEAAHLKTVVARLALHAVLHKCRVMLELGPEHENTVAYVRRLMAGFGLEELAHAMQTNPRDAAQTYRSQLTSILGSIEDVDLEILFQAFHDGADAEQFLAINPPADEGLDLMPDNQPEPAQGLKGLLYYIAEDKAKRDAYEHRGIQCDGCNESPIRGVRWHCLNCPDVDLCSTCEASSRHQQTHVFVKVKIPLPLLSQKGRTLAFPVWYPGDAHLVHEPIQPELRKRLAEEYHYEEPQIDALYDQFITTASLVFDKGPSSVNVAIDRRAFDSALTSKAWTEHNTPNALFDRMFAFYDRNNRGAIFFEDFVSGVAYLRGPRRLQPLKRALQGFDIDSDGFIGRSDFILLLRAKYDVQRELIASASEIRAAKTSLEGIDVIRSSQPISSIFNEQDMPQGELRSSGGKQRNEVGDADLLPGTKVVLEEDDVPTGSGPLPPNVLRVRSIQQLQRQLSRLDDAISHGNVNGNDSGEDRASNREQQFSNLMAEELTAAEAAVLGLGEGENQRTNTVSTARHDALWKFAEMSNNELLDPIFKDKERKDQEVETTAAERQRWRQEIDHAMEQKKIFEENLRSGAELDPLVAAAANSYDRTSKAWMTNQQETQKQQRDEEVQREIHVQMRDNMLPTDTPSLDQFEADIQEQSLEELLAAAGYSVSEDTEESPESSDAPADQTLPQNRPSTPPVPGQQIASEQSAPPSQERLEYLATLDEEEKEIAKRGGPGRLSYDEIESLSSSSEVRSLVISWLELASF
ncbi:hypothetical protein Q7P37_007566 [Cladosporium fusiforme]